MLRLLCPLPLELASALMRGAGDAATGAGWELFFRQEDGLGTIHARRAEPTRRWSDNGDRRRTADVDDDDGRPALPAGATDRP